MSFFSDENEHRIIHTKTSVFTVLMLSSSGLSAVRISFNVSTSSSLMAWNILDASADVFEFLCGRSQYTRQCYCTTRVSKYQMIVEWDAHTHSQHYIIRISVARSQLYATDSRYGLDNSLGTSFLRYLTALFNHVKIAFDRILMWKHLAVDNKSITLTVLLVSNDDLFLIVHRRNVRT